jgi:hypothetical protein
MVIWSILLLVGIFCGNWYILWLFGIFYVYLVHFMVIWYIVGIFGIVYGYLVYFPPFCYVVPKEKSGNLGPETLLPARRKKDNFLESFISSLQNISCDWNSKSWMPGVTFPSCVCKALFRKK